ncbi:hypothetical protein V6Z11_D10G206600 [Gossypium hirsutum]
MKKRSKTDSSTCCKFISNFWAGCGFYLWFLHLEEEKQSRQRK